MVRMISAMRYFDNPAAAKMKGETERIVIGVPKELHHCISEITYRERISFKQYMIDAIKDLNDLIDEAEANGVNKYSAVATKSHNITFTADELVHPSVNIPVHFNETLRDVAHYGADYGIKSYRHLVIDILFSHLDYYKGKYDEVIAGIHTV